MGSVSTTYSVKDDSTLMKTASDLAITSRPATLEDAHFVWIVNNHPTVRSQSLRTGDIPWGTHIEWYRTQLGRSDCGFRIGLERNDRVGVARFDVADGHATISIAISPEHRGRGVGRRLIQLVTVEALARPDVRMAIAYTRPANHASRRAFLHGQYRLAGQSDLAGVTMMRFERTKDDPQ